MHKEYALPVECYHQRSPDTCLAACVRMALHYFGDKIDELDFYHKARFGPKYPGLCDVCIALPLIKRGYSVISYWNGRLEDWGVWTSELSELYSKHEAAAFKTKKYHRRANASPELIKKYLTSGVPIIAEVLAGKFYRTREIGTHMILIRGFDKHGFLICDPWGMQHFVSYEHFQKAWVPSKRFGKSMIAVLPISKSEFPQRLGV
jgi:hypothetical protein